MVGLFVYIHLLWLRHRTASSLVLAECVQVISQAEVRRPSFTLHVRLCPQDCSRVMHGFWLGFTRVGVAQWTM